MNEDNSPHLLLSKQFTSFEELVEMAVAWDLDIRQVSKNHSATTLEQIQAGNLLFSHISCGCFSTHAGETPKNRYTFCLPDAGCPDFRAFGHLIDRPELIASPAAQEFDLIARPGYGLSTFSISDVVLNEYCETEFGRPAENILESWDRIISMPPEITANLRALAQQLSSMAQLPDNWRGRFNPVQSFESAVLKNLFDALLQEAQMQEEPSAAARNRMLKRALDFIGDHDQEPLNVRDLSAAIATSERTLRRLFVREFGITPKKYLLGQRMYGVHRQLWQSNPFETQIIDVANTWGFWHMGQFAKDYRCIFGELPSETLYRSGTIRFA
ncbi:MAG: helix-turn-helix domain-containing protein [gamma proteobacterium endosymbiont of Lamellibrachia anaximandri]|nr:helix-turn-helix domain-containing protein [gamma proteobacterium endosymbiont of Lamellibrachia anaximandri]MBL3532350.1 helix-turn-helix domain-containing protein [gamma proteobacterium endosymbiont of Lamellibrachia anaximandri]